MQAPFRIAMISTRCTHYYLEGGSATGYDIDEPAPNAVGTLYATVEDAKSRIERHYRGSAALWQFRVLDATGAVMATGFRSGPGGTGRSIVWPA